ncbi:hypothetical protein CCHR01_03377 [Colletotrichum chrysophilum]|uniref:Uncharacterized protein n=1 Tax=Colletotrichum chrysophilum TaxID=1836956 RepID=A0AAD9AV59_9PEZI|nr:hypothetical protein CCHR01_03377 [Colletotrichum chrysophilum]
MGHRPSTVNRPSSAVDCRVPVISFAAIIHDPDPSHLIQQHSEQLRLRESGYSYSYSYSYSYGYGYGHGYGYAESLRRGLILAILGVACWQNPVARLTIPNGFNLPNITDICKLRSAAWPSVILGLCLWITYAREATADKIPYAQHRVLQYEPLVILHLSRQPPRESRNFIPCCNIRTQRVCLRTPIRETRRRSSVLSQGTSPFGDRRAALQLCNVWRWAPETGGGR